MIRSARLPGVSEPVLSVRPSSFAPSIVASSTRRRGLTERRAGALPVRPHQCAHHIEEVGIRGRGGIDRQAKRHAHRVQFGILDDAVAHSRVGHLDHRRDAPRRFRLADHLELVGGHALRMHKQHVRPEQIILAHEVDQVLGPAMDRGLQAKLAHGSNSVRNSSTGIEPRVPGRPGVRRQAPNVSIPSAALHSFWTRARSERSIVLSAAAPCPVP